MIPNLTLLDDFFTHLSELKCYAIFVSPDITRQRGGASVGTPCICLLLSSLFRILLTNFTSRRRELLRQGRALPASTWTDKYSFNDDGDDATAGGAVDEKLEHYFDVSIQRIGKLHWPSIIMIQSGGIGPQILIDKP